jgi:glycosyltransferase involved in cell wall biosynthesis
VSSKPVLIFVFPDCIGGVASFNRNLINYTSLRRQCHIRAILLNDVDARRDSFTDHIQADEVIRFEFSAYENQFSVCKRLNVLLGKEKGSIVADNALVLNTIGIFGSSKRIIYLVHDYFYINWALQYSRLIDCAVAHSSFFRDILIAASVKDYNAKAFFIPYGVELPVDQWQKRSPAEDLKLVFLGRLVEEKGVLLLKKIDEILQLRKIRVSWTIIGKGSLLSALQKQWLGISYIKFVQAKDTNQVYSSLEDQDILVFPSQFEGTPVSIMEALSRGVVPVVSDLPGGTRDMVTADIGVLCNVPDEQDYANAITHLYNHPDILRKKQEHCIQKGRELYDIKNASDAYFSFLIGQTAMPVQDTPTGIRNFSRMDKKIFPDKLVYFIRKFNRKIH